MNTLDKKNRFKGFTLVELIVVIALIGILSSGLLILLDPVAQLQKGRDAKRKSDLVQIQRAIETFYQDNGKYPDNATNVACPYQIKGDNGDSNDCITWGESWNPYIAKIPKEENPNRRYVYYVTGSAQVFYLYTHLERKEDDLQACNADGSTCANAIDGANPIVCGSTNEVCNFGVSSPNTTP